MNPPASPPPGPTSVYPDWPQYAGRIVAAVRDLTDAQLALRASPGHAPIWALAAHVASTRIYWLCHVFGEPGADRTPFVDPSGEGWEDDLTHPRSAAELVAALESTWTVIADCLERWGLDTLDRTAERRWGDVVRVHTRASVLNRLLTHEAFHAGEISQVLGAHDLPVIDLWARRPPT
jgi:hypothetical protein